MSEDGSIEVGAEAPGDVAAIRAVNERAFGAPVEANLVDALRGQVTPWISLVARRGGAIVGHILFTPVTVESEAGTFAALALGPMAVRPEVQRQGIGSQLVRAGLAACEDAGHPIVIVLGHPDYYPRFGFQPASAHGLRCTWDVPDPVFMVIELEPGALRGRTGLVHYHAEFDRVA